MAPRTSVSALDERNRMNLTFDPAGQTLLQLAIVLAIGIVGGELVSKFRLPKVTGWILTGILLRGTAAHHQLYSGLDVDAANAFGPYMNFVLGYIAFTVGAALHFASLRNFGKRLTMLLVGEAIITTSVVTAAMYFIGRRINPDVATMRSALVLAAIAIAGAPGTTVLVVREARSRGVLTRTLLAAVALIDMIAVGVFVFVASYLAVGADDGALWHANWPTAIGSVAHQFGFAIGIGTVTVFTALLLTRTIVGPTFVGPTMVVVILGAWGAASGFGVSGILTCTFAGMVLTNVQHDTVRSAEAYLHSIGGVLFAAFYTLAGMKLDLLLVAQAVGLVGLYFAARFIGKYAGAFLAMSLADVPARVRNYLGLALIPHGGVAVGLVILVQNDPNLSDIASTVTTVGLAALAINQLVGPNTAKFALSQAGEANKDFPRLLDFLDEQHITVELNGTNKEEVIRELVRQLYATRDKPEIDEQTFCEQVLAREEQETTCMTEGLMIPHCELDTTAAMTGVLGISSKGIDLNAPDGRPVHAVLLLATPKSDRKRHLEVLAAFAHAITKDGNLREQLYHARSAAHAYEVLHADEAKDINYFIEEAFERAGVSSGRDD